MRRWAGLAAAALLGACSFWSERPLFRESEGAAPFADGARFEWREGDGDEEDVVYRRVGRGYELLPADDGEQPMDVLFVAVHQTAEEDYIAQVSLPNGDNVRVYAFMWRTQEGYRVIAAPRAFAEDSPGRQMMDRICTTQPNGECKLDSREQIMELYLDVVYPAFVAGGETPADFIDQIPVEAAPGQK